MMDCSEFCLKLYDIIISIGHFDSTNVIHGIGLRLEYYGFQKVSLIEFSLSLRRDRLSKIIHCPSTKKKSRLNVNLILCYIKILNCII